MCKCTNVVILAKVTAQYFFYQEYFMYLLYILCIGLHSYMIVTGILLKRVFVCNSTDFFAILEQEHGNTDFLLQDQTLLMQECDFAVDNRTEMDS